MSAFSPEVGVVLGLFAAMTFDTGLLGMTQIAAGAIVAVFGLEACDATVELLPVLEMIFRLEFFGDIFVTD